MELIHFKKKLATAIHGHKLLKDKRDELMRQFLNLVRENKVLREEVGAGIATVNQNFVLARSGTVGEAPNVALMAPKQEVYLETETKDVMSVETPVFKYKARASDPNDICSYGFAFTSSDLGDAVKSLAGLLPDTLRLTGCEKSCRLMTTEIKKTHRRVNVLEHVMIPDTQSNTRYITMKLDESGQSSQTRFMKAKDMMFEEVHHYSEWEAVPAVGEIQQAFSWKLSKTLIETPQNRMDRRQ